MSLLGFDSRLLNSEGRTLTIRLQELVRVKCSNSTDVMLLQEINRKNKNLNPASRERIF